MRIIKDHTITIKVYKKILFYFICFLLEILKEEELLLVSIH